jgi:hypothetical protein
MKNKALIVLTIFLSVLLIVNIANAIETSHEYKMSLLAEEANSVS